MEGYGRYFTNVIIIVRFKEKLEKGMVNFFRRIQPQSPMLRNNYFIQVDDKLAWSESIGSEDATAEGEVGWFTAEKNKAIEHHYFRSERQSLRRYVAIIILIFYLYSFTLIYFTHWLKV